MKMPHDRRTFLTGLAVALPAARLGAQSGAMPYRTLGRTGEKVSLVGLGGFHAGNPKDDQAAIRLIRAAIDNGINFLDNCWAYHNGRSEELMGKALRDGYRQKAFLMTKLEGRTRQMAEKQLDDCLRRLAVDTIDLMQIHEVIRESDPDRIFGPNGSMEALLAAKKAGKIRYIGFTGHKDPDIHLKMLNAGFAQGFTPDAVQLPLNVLDPHYRSFEKLVLPVLVKRNIGVLAMKPLAFGALLKSGADVSVTEALHYVMNLPVSVVITGFDTMPHLEQALQAAVTYRPMNKRQVAALLAKTAHAGGDGKFEAFKTTERFDATSRHPEWLG
jgi:aryl-alcohol dehydrogenase-like predicted oxidoreductase